MGFQDKSLLMHEAGGGGVSDIMGALGKVQPLGPLSMPPSTQQGACQCPTLRLHNRSRPGSLGSQTWGRHRGQGGGWEKVRQWGQQLGLSPALQGPSASG